jgi:hypothetical protein
MLSEPSKILHTLLEGGHRVIAGRLCGALHNIGKDRIANEIKKTMVSAGFDIRERDPFTTATPILFENSERSPHVNRMNIMWHEMRKQVLDNFPNSPGIPVDINAYLKNVDTNYLTDAYHSLSIEGYQVSLELIEKVRSEKRQHWKKPE